MNGTWGCPECGHAKAGHDERGCPACNCRADELLALLADE